MKQLQSLNVLVIEDNPGDVLLLQSALEADSLSIFKITAEETLAAGLKQLLQAGFDIVLVDLGLPDSAGLQTFEAIHRAAPELPVVVFSGNDDEQRAVDVVRTGAQDYLVKSLSGFEMAARTIRYAIERTRNEQRFAQVAAAVPGALTMLRSQADGQMSLIFASHAFEDIFGLPNAEVNENVNAIIERIPPEEIQRILSQLQELTMSLQAVQIEFSYQHPLKGAIWLENRARPVQEADGSVVWYGFTSDITERKRAEEKVHASEAQFSTIFHANPIGIILTQLEDGHILDVNDAFLKIFGYPREQVIGRTTLDLHLYPNPNDRARIIGKLLEKGHLFGEEARFQRSSGEIGTVFLSAETLELGGKKKLLSMMVDITERKQAEEKLQTLTNLLSDGQRIAHMGSFEYDAKTKRTVWSEEECRIYGYDPAQPSPDYEAMLAHSIHPADADLLNRTFVTAMQNDTVYELEHRIVRPDGSARWVYDRALPYFDEYGQLLRYVGVTQDITERKQSEEIIRESETRLKGFLDSTPDAMVIVNSEGRIIFANVQAENLFGYPHEELLQQELDMLIPERFRATHDGHRAEYFAEPRSRQMGSGLELSARKRDGSEIPVEITLSHHQMNNETVVLSAIRDISERKAAEEKLRESEALLRQVLESTPDAIFAVDREYRLLINNEQHQQVLVATGGHPLEVGESVFPPDYPPEMLQDWRAMYDRAFNGETSRVELAWTDIYGKPRAYENNISPLHDAAGAIIGVLATAHDITERKQADEKLREREGQLQALVTSLDDIVFEVDEHGKYLNVWTANDAMLFQPREQIIDHRFDEVFGAEASRPFFEYLDRCLHSGETQNLEYPVELPEGTHWFNARYNPIYSKSEKPQSVSIMVRDITELKQAADKLRESESRSKAMLNSIPDLMFRLDRAGVFLDYKADVNDLYAQSEPTILGKRNRDIAPPEFADLIEQKIAAALASGSLQTFEYQLPIPNQGIQYYEARMSPSGTDEVTAIVRNITERKEAELAVLEKAKLQEQLEKTASIVPGMLHIFKQDADGKFSMPYASPAIGDVYGLDFADVAEDMSPAFARIDAQDVPHVTATIAESVNTMKPWHDEFRYHHPQKGERWLEGNSTPVREADGSLLWYGILQDITERKQAENRLRESNDTAQAILNAASESVFLMNLDGTVIAANETTAARLGKTVPEVVGKNMFDLLPEHIVASRKEWVEVVTRERKAVRFEDERLGVWMENNVYPIFDIGGQVQRVAIFGRDITNRKKAEENLRASEEKFRLLAETIDEVFWMFDNRQMKIIYISPAYEKTWGRPVNSLYESPQQYIEVILPEDRQIMFEALEKQARGEQTEMEYRIVRPDGSTRWIHDRSFPVFDGEGVVISTTGIAADITEKKKADLALRESEEKYRILSQDLEQRVLERTAEVYTISERLKLATQAAQLGVWDWDVKTNTLHWDDQMFIISRRDKASFSANLEFSLSQMHPDDVGTVMQKTQELLAGTLAHGQIEYRILRGDGSIGHLKTHGVVQYDTEGQIANVIGMVQDVTEERLAEQALRESQENLQYFLDTASDLIQSMNENGEYLYVNQAWCNALGYTPEEASRLNMLDVIAPEQHQHCRNLLQELIRDQSSHRLEVAFITKQGERILVDGSVSSRREKGGHIATNGIFRNITERKKAEDALRESYDQLTVANIALEKAMRVKDEFLASMSHELRTPLTGILGLAEALQMNVYGEMSEKQQKSVKTIQESGKHLLALINDILDLSKIEAGKLEIQFSPCSLTDICQASLQLTKGMAHQKRQNVHYSATTEPILLNVDVRRVKQIIVNLLSNAIKFTPVDGELGLSVEPDEKNGRVRITVWDKGIGIKPENMPKLFQPFTQIDSSLEREYSGTGLGLSLVEQLARLHGGSVEVESAFGEGSRFTVTLPWAPHSAQKSSAVFETSDQLENDTAAKEDQAAQLILIVDDNQILLDMMADFLKAQGYRTEKVLSGKELLEKVTEIKPHLILMDIQMPGLNGMDTIRRVRKHPNAAIAATPIIAVTALAMDGDRERCLEAGANDYASKPLNLNKIKELIEVHIKSEN